MKSLRGIIISVILLSFGTGFGQLQKLAQTGMKFLSVSTDPKISAMGDAASAVEGRSESMFFNPAGMARLDHNVDAAVGSVRWIAGINYGFGSVAFRPMQGKFGVIGVSVVNVMYGDFKSTIRSSSERGYEDMGTFSPSAGCVGVGYANALTDKFAIGGNIKYVYQNLGSAVTSMLNGSQYGRTDYSRNVMAFDFGILYRTGYKSLFFGMHVRNFSQEIKYLEEGFQLPLTFKVGLSMNLFDLYDIDPAKHSLLVSVDAVHPRDYPEQINVGGEYVLANLFAVRAGYSTPNDEHGFNAGVGLVKDFKNYQIGWDYAYTPFGLFGDVHRFSFHFAL